MKGNRTVRVLRTQGRLFAAPVTLLALALLMLAAAVACGGGSDDTSKTPTAAATGPGTITVTSTAITGRSGQMLLVYAEREGQPGNVAVACIRIDSNSFSASGVALADVPAGNDPCSGSAQAKKFPEGRYTLTTGVYAPPAQSPEKKVTQAVQVSGNVKVVLDGPALSK